ncbi:MAG: RlmE family RNA methyltransferase [Candidatus Gracilibacteria bacterium]|nr:RlmE family RNA methyltransferase [Candidatus Gracilibacteria bacterium]
MSKKKGVGQFVAQDKYFLEAKRLGYRARSAFKLLEVQDKFSLIKPNYNVLDIGAAPGSFLQAIRKIVGEKPKIVGIDIQKIEKLPFDNIFLLQESIFEKNKITEFINSIGIKEFDVITSDIAPSTTGQTGVDQYRSVELNLAILDVADIFLKKGGNLLLKVFVGEDINDLVFPIKKRYEKFSRFKPKACRDRSFEEYFICLGKK